MEEEGGDYAELSLHRKMLRDGVRNEAYRQAIFKTVKSGDVVLDVGAGSGILSLFAAQAGARKVYAVERTSMAEMIGRIAERNGVQDVIEISQRDIETFVAPEPVDVIVSEWMGGYGVDENMLTLVLDARDLWLKPGGKMLPEQVTAWMAPVCDSKLDEEMNLWRSRPHGADLSPIAEDMAEEPRSMVERFGERLPVDVLAVAAVQHPREAEVLGQIHLGDGHPKKAGVVGLLVEDRAQLLANALVQMRDLAARHRTRLSSGPGFPEFAPPPP